MSAFLFKTEPSGYAWDDLVREKRTTWNGVSSPAALIHLRSVKKGDTVVIYHSGADKCAVGLARAVSAPYPDPALGDPRRVVVDLVPVEPFRERVPLATFRADRVLRSTELVRISRLSVMPLSAAQHARVLELAGLPAAR